MLYYKGRIAVIKIVTALLAATSIWEIISSWASQKAEETLIYYEKLITCQGAGGYLASITDGTVNFDIL